MRPSPTTSPTSIGSGQPATDGDGFLRPQPPSRTAMPIDRQYDINANIGGPLWKGKAWFFYSYRLNDQYKYVLNFDELARSKLSNQYTFKGTFQLIGNNQIIGYLEQAREAAGAAGSRSRACRCRQPTSSRRATTPGRSSGPACLSDRMFLDVIVGNWYNFFPLDTTANSGAYTGTLLPGRIEIGPEHRFDGGANIAYQNQLRYKPQFTASLSYAKDGWHGTHDFKFGAEGRRERRSFFAPQPFNHVYYDATGGLGRTPQEIEFYNTPNTAVNQTNNVSAYVNDTWRFNSKLTLNLGLRVDYYKDLYPGAERDARGRPGTHRRRHRPQPPRAVDAVHRAAYRSRELDDRGAAGRLRLRPQGRRQVRHQGVLRALLLQLGARHDRGHRSIPLGGRGCAIAGPT